jgi:CubicO group peptidase (beta-lactamase class C family)
MHQLLFVLFALISQFFIRIPFSFAATAVTAQTVHHSGNSCATINIDTNTKCIKSTITTFIKQQHIPGAAVVIYDNGSVKQYVFGYSDLKKKTPVTTNTLFELGSITKTFTGLLLAQEVEQGRLHFDDTLNASNIFNNKLDINSINQTNSIDSAESIVSSMKNITLLDLATHTSGLPAKVPNVPYNAGNSPKYTRYLHDFLKTWKFPYQPSTEFVYSNIGFSLLGQEIANHVKTPYITLVKQNILEPLMMQRTYFTVPAAMYPFYAKGYTATGALARTSNAGCIPASWAIKSSIVDMANYLQIAVGVPIGNRNIGNNNNNNQSININIANALQDNSFDGLIHAMKVAQTAYVQIINSVHQEGLGWSIIPLEKLDKLLDKTEIKVQPPFKTIAIKDPKYNQHTFIEKTGATDGFRAYIAVIPDRKVGIVILTNKFTPTHDALPEMGRKLLVRIK